MKRKPSKKELLTYTVNKILDSVPECKTEAELLEFLKKDALRSKAERVAEGKKILAQSKEELENATYLY